MPDGSLGGAGQALLDIRGLKTWFKTDDGMVRAVDGVSLAIWPGETLAVVGESGCGKTVTARSVLKLIDMPPGRFEAGQIVWRGRDLLPLSSTEMDRIRAREIGMVFQEPMTSLNPIYTVGDQIAEAIRKHARVSRKAALETAVEMMRLVQIPNAARRVHDYPHQFSGGMRQRVMIAMALACRPQLLIADEPTTALDVTIQAQILELIKTLKRDTGTSVIMITHDLGVVAGMTDRILVMYAGRIVETAPTQELFERPSNPYTAGLLASVPDPADDSHAELYQIPGLPPDVARLPPGCPFAPRCARAESICREEFPPFVQLTPQHQSLCHFAVELYTADGSARRREGAR